MFLRTLQKMNKYCLQEFRRVERKTKLRKNKRSKVIYRQNLEGNGRKFEFEIVLINVNRFYGRILCKWEMTSDAFCGHKC